MVERKKKYKELPIGGVLPGGTSTDTKTGSWREKIPVWNEKKCIQCMKCVIACPEDCINTKEVNGKIKRTETDLNYCKGCGICANVCPVGAITMKYPEELTDEEKIIFNKEQLKKYIKKKKT
jgi:pyruvate ferredoxin oxidoreductase delta subunit